MGVNLKKMTSDNKAAWQPIQLIIGTTATGQTNKQTCKVTLGFAFEIVRAEFYCLTRPNAGFATNIRIGSTLAATAVSDPTADAATAATLSTTLTNRRGSATDALSCIYTTDADGAATNGLWTVWVRPLGMNGDSQ